MPETPPLEAFHNAGAMTASQTYGFDLVSLFPQIQVSEIAVVNAGTANLIASSTGKTIPRIGPSGKGLLSGQRMQELLITPDATVNTREVTILVKGPPSAYVGGRRA